MKIEIEIPDPFNTSADVAMINIKGDNFFYGAPDNRFCGLQSQFSQVDEEKEQELKIQCIKIEEAVRTMIELKLL